MMKRTFLYSLPLFAALGQMAMAHDSLVPHVHPHDLSPVLGTGQLIVAALLGLAVLLAYKPVKKSVIRALNRRRK